MTERKILYVPTNQMIWNQRVFTLKPAVVEELKTSMKAIGQLQPIVVIPGQEEDSPFTLTIGRHRYQAVKELYKEDPTFIHTFLGKPCPPGTIPSIDIHDIPPEILLNMEISENVHRMDLTWQEKASALALLHTTEKEKFDKDKADGVIPETAAYTISNTARKLAGVTGGSTHAIVNKISQSLILAKQLDDPDVVRAESAKSAFNVVRHKLTMEARKMSVDYEGETQHELIVGDCADVMSDMLDEQADHPHVELKPFKLILADPPYGIGANTYDNMKEHKYDDSWPNAELVYGAIAGYGYNLCADGANLLFFCAPERWHCVRDIAEEAGWISWPRPIIWKKSNEGMRPWGAQGLAYTYECIYWGTKGKKLLLSTHNDIFDYYKPKSSEREHAAAKPVELLAKLMELTCLPGDWILDPCVGSGTSFKAGFLRKTRVLGIENNEETATIARKNLFWIGEAEPGPVSPAPAYETSLSDL